MDNKWIDEAWNFIQERTYDNNKAIGSCFPHATRNGKYILENEQWWTAGFWPGILWRVYLDSKDEELKYSAEQCENKMEHLLSDAEKVDHDLGFMWTLSSLADYKITKNQLSRRRALLAANLLAARFNINGNYIRAWNSWNNNDDNSGVVIIDSLMNLPLLYWASEEIKDPRFKAVAERHLDTILKYFIREDGSVQHMIRFDSNTGELLERCGGQGFSTNSSWARGCAWAVYGLALSYKYTKDENVLNAAKKVTHYFIANMSGHDYPLWDFRIPKDGDEKYSYPDSSAGAIAACGMLLLAEEVNKNESDLYYNSAFEMLKKLYETCSTRENNDEQGLLKHGTGHFPERNNLDVSLIYGDYFFTEGISVLKGYKLLFW